jgi:hypothetical protein
VLGVIELDPNSPLLDVEFVDVTRKPFFADRERLYSRAAILPVAIGRVVGGRLQVTSNQEYVAWARLLGKPARVMISGESEAPEQLGPQVRIMSPAEAREEGESMYDEPAWQIYRFERGLSSAEQVRFSDAVRRGLSATGRSRLCSPITFFDDGSAVEFTGFVPPYDDYSRRELQISMLRFSAEVVRIVAFNGRRFGPP